MKKQLLLILMLALLAGTNHVYAQAIGGSLPQAITCVNSPFNPIAGVPYDYSATLNPALGVAYWYATNSTTFMNAGGRPLGIELATGGAVVASATNYMNNANNAASPSTTNITWTSGGLAANTPALPTDPPTLFVVVEYTAPVTGCANNVKVYPIRPRNAFVVDIMNMTQAPIPAPAGYGNLVEQCFQGVQSAVYNPTGGPAPDGGVTYDFGIQYLYYEVVAANFTGSYTPTFQLSGLQPLQTADIDWGVTVGLYGNTVTSGATNGTFPGSAVTTALMNTSTGVSIYVRVTVHNNNYEGIAQVPVTLAVDAVNSALQPDVDNATCLPVAFNDLTLQNLNARPTVNQVAPGVFLPIAP